MAEGELYNSFSKDLYKLDSDNQSSQISSLTSRTELDPTNIGSGNLAAEWSQDVGNLNGGKIKFDNTQVGYILGLDKGVAKFYIGDTTNYLNWTGTSLVLTGSITATSGTFGSWTISGNSFSTTNNNILIGTDAGHDITTGQYNLMFGFEAGYHTTEGVSNTYLGYQAGHSGTTNDFNVCVGWQAGLLNLGEENTFIGFQSGQGMSSGSLNVFIGPETGLQNTSGSSNVFLGHQAGYYETGSNKLFIDNTGRSSEADARTKALIYGIFDTVVTNQYLYVNGNLRLGVDLPVSEGGTGVSSNTAYAVLCGGTTSTGAIQSVASVGSTGQVLTSNGAGALPTFQALPANGFASRSKATVTLDLQDSQSTSYAHRIIFDTEVYDGASEFDNTVTTITADAGTNTTTIVDAATTFVAGDVGKCVWNDNQNLGSVITVVNDSHTVTISPAITSQTTGDTIYMAGSRFVAAVTGYYSVNVMLNFADQGGQYMVTVNLEKNSSVYACARNVAPTGTSVDKINIQINDVVALTAGDVLTVTLQTSNAGSFKPDSTLTNGNYFTVSRVY